MSSKYYQTTDPNLKTNSPPHKHVQHQNVSIESEYWPDRLILAADDAGLGVGGEDVGGAVEVGGEQSPTLRRYRLPRRLFPSAAWNPADGIANSSGVTESLLNKLVFQPIPLRKQRFIRTNCELKYSRDHFQFGGSQVQCSFLVRS